MNGMFSFARDRNRERERERGNLGKLIILRQGEGGCTI